MSEKVDENAIESGNIAGAKMQMHLLEPWATDGKWRLAAAVLGFLRPENFTDEEKDQLQSYIDAFEPLFETAQDGKTELPPGDFEETEGDVSVEHIRQALDAVKEALDQKS